MTGKQRVHAALEGRAVGRMPVTVLYSQLYHLDHFAELTGRPQWKMHRWRYALPEEHLRLFRRMVREAPFEILQPQLAPSRQEREETEFFERDGRVYRRDRRRGTVQALPQPVSGHAMDDRANETQHVYDERDVAGQVRMVKAQDLLAAGTNDYLDAAVTALGEDQFILSGGVVGTLYASHHYVGLTNLYALLVEKPALITCLSQRILQQNIETIRMLAAAGGDAIYIDDATATSDMISVAHYERFCMPYLREMVREIHALGHKAILIYFGGIMDRLEQIASLGADGLAMETSMKGYANDTEAIAQAIGDRVTLFGNLDPIGVLQNGSDPELQAEVARQVAAGRRARGFLVCTGSPITPGTPLRRVRRFIELGRQDTEETDLR